MPHFTPLHATAPALMGPLRFTLPAGAHTLVVEPWSDAVLAVHLETIQPLPDSPAVLPPAMPLPELAVEATSDGWRVGLGAIALRVTTTPLTLAWETPEGLPLWSPMTVGTLGDQLTIEGPLLPADGCFGLGEKPGYLDRRGRKYVFWNTDNSGVHTETHDALYQSIPFLLTRHEGRHAGWLFDDPGRTHLDLGASDPSRWRYRADGPGLRLFAVAGPQMASVVRRYGELTGRMAMPPRWALGFHQSRWSYPSREAVAAIAREFRTRRIPADVIHIDIDYMDAYKVFTWSDTRFPDPEGLLAALAKDGFSAVTIVDPGVKREPGYRVHDECLNHGYYIRNTHGAPYIGKVWPGECLFPDFIREDVRAWWGDQHKALLDVGVAGIWTDMNEPSVFKDPGTPYEERTIPDDARQGPSSDEVPHRQVHNLFANGMAQATREGLLRLRPDTRPFVISRAGYAGIQRHAMVWTGDNHSSWAHLEMSLPMCLNLGLSGLAFVGPDVGGFGGDCTSELLVRWTQAGAFFPFFRNHSAHGTRHQEPWAFGPEAEALCREAIGWRYRLLPYLYGVFQEAVETGLPVMRPMPLSYPHEPACRPLFDQFMLGADLLVAPVLRPGLTQRSVYFPTGRWAHLMTGEVHTGPGFAVVSAPLDQIPVFVREGAAVPLGPVVQHTGEPVDTLTLHLGPGAGWAGRFYDDDGRTLGYQRGAYNAWRFEGGFDEGGVRLTVACDHEGYDSPIRQLAVSLPWGGTVGPARFNGEDVPTTRLEGRRLVATVPLRPGELTIARV